VCYCATTGPDRLQRNGSRVAHPVLRLCSASPLPPAKKACYDRVSACQEKGAQGALRAALRRAAAVLAPACGDGEVLPGPSWCGEGPRSPQEAPWVPLPFGWAGDGAAGPLWGAVGRVRCCDSPDPCAAPLRPGADAPAGPTEACGKPCGKPRRQLVEKPVENLRGGKCDGLLRGGSQLSNGCSMVRGQRGKPCFSPHPQRQP
jgi:hypothetical protein